MSLLLLMLRLPAAMAAPASALTDLLARDYGLRTFAYAAERLHITLFNLGHEVSRERVALVERVALQVTAAGHDSAFRGRVQSGDILARRIGAAGRRQANGAHHFPPRPRQRSQAAAIELHAAHHSDAGRDVRRGATSSVAALDGERLRAGTQRQRPIRRARAVATAIFDKIFATVTFATFARGYVGPTYKQKTYCLLVLSFHGEVAHGRTEDRGSGAPQSGRPHGCAAQCHNHQDLGGSAGLRGRAPANRCGARREAGGYPAAGAQAERTAFFGRWRVRRRHHDLVRHGRLDGHDHRRSGPDRPREGRGQGTLDPPVEGRRVAENFQSENAIKDAVS